MSNDKDWLSMMGKVGRPTAQYSPVGAVDHDEEPTSEAGRRNRQVVKEWREKGDREESDREFINRLIDGYATAKVPPFPETPAFDTSNPAYFDVDDALPLVNIACRYCHDASLGPRLWDAWVEFCHGYQERKVRTFKRLPHPAQNYIMSRGSLPHPPDSDHRTPAELHFDKIVSERRVQGRQTYGKGLDHTDTRYDYNREALCEALDGWQYTATENLQLLERVARLEALLTRTLPRIEGYAIYHRRAIISDVGENAAAAENAEKLHAEIMAALREAKP